MKTPFFWISILILLFTSGACTQDDDPVKEIDLTLKSQKIVKADNEFGLDLFQLIYEHEVKDNFMISPLSISMAFSMTYNGAETTTKEEMAAALRISDFTRDELNETYKNLIEALISIDPEVTMEVANSIWYRNTYPVEQNFLDVNSTYYSAEVNAADFNNPNTVNLINNWVSDKTHEKIPTIIQEIPGEAVLFLINAIYFNGSWTQEFNPESTQDLSFQLDDESYVSTSMMNRVDTLNYLSNELFSAIELPYGDENFNMIVLLPNADKNVADIVSQMSINNWETWQTGFETTNTVDILLPKFKIEYEIKLNDILKSMGMEEAFTTSADFSGINKNHDLFITYVKHKTFIEVDEEGTEATAVTIIGFGNTSIDPDEPQKTYFHCTRPFLFAITEKSTGAILFMGKVGNPKISNE